MVFGGRLDTHGRGHHKITHIHMEHLTNWGGSSVYEVDPVSIWLFTPNYTLVILLPSATLESHFVIEGADLLNVGGGYATVKPVYYVGLKWARSAQRDTIYITYSVKKSSEVMLDYYNAISLVFALAPVSSLV